MDRQILILGSTGILGLPVVNCLADKGHRVRVLARDAEKAGRTFGKRVEVVEGSALNKDHVQSAMRGCDGVHISLSQESELIALEHVLDLAEDSRPERITYVSATTAREENRWFEVIDVKMRAENRLRQSGIAHTVFCPTWAMETLCNFIKRRRAVIILGKNPPPLHFFAAADFGRIVAASYEDDRALGKRLFVHGPEAIRLPDAIERFVSACHPGLNVMRMKLWQARLLAKVVPRLTYITRLIAYFDQVGELGDPAETNALFGAPSITLNDWFKLQKE